MASQQKKRVIKRYSNRKLYDTTARRFTTLAEIGRLLEKEVRVVVRDHDTGEDRTDEVLAPVLARRVARQPGGADLIAGLLRAPVQLAGGLTGTLAVEPRTGRTSYDDVELAEVMEDRATEDADRRDEEIRELRAQVSQLTDAVTLLLQEKNAELAG